MNHHDALITLEERIRSLPGVVGVVLTSDGNDRVGELQIFTAAGTSEHEIRGQLRAILAPLDVPLDRVFVFELAAEPPSDQPIVFEVSRTMLPGEAHTDAGREPTGSGSPEPGDAGGAPVSRQPRLAVRRVDLRSEGPTTHARVALARAERDQAGQAVAPATSFNLRLVARATLDALDRFLDQPRAFELVGAALVEVLGRQVVVVLLRRDAEDAVELVGACPVGNRAVHEATVRATLDAVNRQLTADPGSSGLPDW